MTLRDKLMTIVLFFLLLFLLFLTPQHPWHKWQWPCYFFCVATLFFLLPSVAAILAPAKIKKTAKHRSRPLGAGIHPATFLPFSSDHTKAVITDKVKDPENYTALRLFSARNGNYWNRHKGVK